VKRKQRLLLRHGLFSVLVLGLCAWLALELAGSRDEDNGGVVPGLFDSSVKTGRAPELKFRSVPLQFRHFPGDRSHRLPEDMGSGVAAEDLDGDGLIDLVFLNAAPLGEPQPQPAVFRNLGGGRFEKVATELPALMGMGVSTADYDADGDVDLYLTGYGKNVLLRNDGAFRFTDVTREAGVVGGGFSTGSCWGDVDGDGDLDLYVCRYVAFDESMKVTTTNRGTLALPATLNPAAFDAQSNLLFINEAGVFEEAAERFGVTNPKGRGLSALFVDFDGDGFLDLYVANDMSDNVFYRGTEGAFEDITYSSLTADWRGAMGLAAGDFDRDNDLDLLITHWKTEENALYRNETGMRFLDVATRLGLGHPSRARVGWSCDFADFDCDGRPDFFVVNGSTFERRNAPAYLEPMHLQLFWNNGRAFVDTIPTVDGTPLAPFVGRGGVAADLDGDGDLDLVATAHGETPRVLLNESERGGHLFVELRGSAPNTLAYGAIVTVEVGGRKQMQTVGAKVGYLSAGPAVLHFGLGDAERADRISVRFLSGKTAERRGVRAGTRVRIKEVDARSLGAQQDRARDLLDAGKPAEAAALYREMIRLDPLYADALYALVGLTRGADAVSLCDRLIRLEPELGRGYLARAALLIGAGEFESAFRDIEHARRLNPNETGALLALGRLLMLQGKIREAAVELHKARRNPRAAALAALCHFRLGEPERARALIAPRKSATPEGVSEEGDVASKSIEREDPLALLLRLPSAEGWTSVTRDANEPFPASNLRQPGAQQATFDGAMRWALDPPATCMELPPRAVFVVEADVDGDGRPDRIVRCRFDRSEYLPWWVLLRRGDVYVPIRGIDPTPGFELADLAAVDLDGDGRFEVLLRGRDQRVWSASYSG